jgi:hypothetical protein
MILQVEGETWVRGMTLYEFADFAVELGMYSAINLDGGGSATMSQSGVLVSEPSWHCRDPSNELFAPYSYCEKEVSSILCVHALPPLPFIESTLPTTAPTLQPSGNIIFIGNGTETKGYSPKGSISSDLFAIIVTAMLLVSVLYNCRLRAALQRQSKSVKTVELQSHSSGIGSKSERSAKLTSTPLKGNKASPSVSYSQVVQADSDESDEEAIEFNDLDMNPKEFNPFNRLRSSV